MGIFELLRERGEFDYSVFFNGKLSDFLASHQDNFSKLFEEIVQQDADCCLYTNCELNINFENISNKKIGYKDIGKLPENSIRIPYILYWSKDGKERAMLIDTNTYCEAKGMYYCASEPGNSFEQQKSDILGINLTEENTNEVLECFKDMQDNSRTVGSIQRKYDSRQMGDIDDCKDASVETSEKMFQKAIEEIAAAPSKEEKAKIIYNVVKRAFLMKKALYVSYMTNKYLLNQRHGGNVTEQRKFAKAYCDEIHIIPYYNLWNGTQQQQQ